MRNLPSIVANYESASTGFSDGKLRDNPGDDTGSGVMSAWGNDIWYALRAIVTKWHGAGDVSDTPESENNHDVLSAIEQMMGLDVYGVDAYNPATTYSTLGESVMYAGIQFVNINASGNTNKDPLTEHDYWLPVPDSRYLFLQSAQGIPQWGASHPIHDFNKAAYKQYFGLGVHRIGGYNGTTFNAYGVHLDGQPIGGSGTALSGIVEAWHLKNVWFPSSGGSRKSKDARGRLLRAIDSSGGQATVMAGVLEDQMQQITGSLTKMTTSIKAPLHTSNNSATGALSQGASVGSVNLPVSTSGDFPGSALSFNSANSPGARTGLTTRDKSVTGGVPYMVVMVPA
jgi:hypothetical protein